MNKKLKDTRSSPYFEPDSDWLRLHKADIKAIQNLMVGTASEAQQKRAIMFILEDLCGRDGNQYHLSQRDTDFALGKKFVGDHIVGAIKAPLGQIKE